VHEPSQSVRAGIAGWLLAVTVAVLLLGAACSSGNASSASGAGDAADNPTKAPTHSSEHGATPGDAGNESPGTPDAGVAGGVNGGDDVTGSVPPASGSNDGGKRKPGPAPVDFPYKDELAVSSTISPTCVTAGGRVELTVESKPEAALGWQAVYADGYGGSDPPFGRGYGGNDKGFTNGDGFYESSWIVAPNAPSGPGRVDVVIGKAGKWGYDGPHFAVADSSGNCPEKWLEDDGRGK
jgi:hypothetical protein